MWNILVSLPAKKLSCLRKYQEYAGTDYAGQVYESTLSEKCYPCRDNIVILIFLFVFRLQNSPFHSDILST